QHVARPADVIGRDGTHRLADIDSAQPQVVQLLVVGVTLAQCRGEDRRIGGDAHHRLLPDQGREVARAQPLAAEIIEPYGHALLGEALQDLAHGQFPVVSPLSAPVLARLALAAATTRSAVKPNCSKRVLYGAEAPKCSKL